MEIDSTNRYLSAIEAQSVAQASTMRQLNLKTADTSSDSDDSDSTDSYESTISATEAAIPCENYGDIMELIKANKQANGDEEGAPTEDDFAAALAQLEAEEADETDTSDTTTETIVSGTTTSTTDETSETTETSDTDSTSSASSASGSSDDSDSDETVTETVVASDGSVYLKTTTTSSDGSETVTMQKIADGQPMEQFMKPQGEPGMNQSNDQNMMSMNFDGSIPPMMPPYDEALTTDTTAAEEDAVVEETEEA